MSSVERGWLRAVDEELIIYHLGVANCYDTYEEAKRKLGLLIQWHVDVATDPAVNGGYSLVKQEHNTAQALFKELKLYRALQIEYMLAYQYVALGIIEDVVESEQQKNMLADRLAELEQHIKKVYDVNVKELLDVY